MRTVKEMKMHVYATIDYTFALFSLSIQTNVIFFRSKQSICSAMCDSKLVYNIDVLYEQGAWVAQ